MWADLSGAFACRECPWSDIPGAIAASPCKTEVDLRCYGAERQPDLRALDVRVMLVPLIAAGVGPLTPAQSFRAILKSLAAFEGVHGEVTIRIVVFKESLLPRADVGSILREVLPPDAVFEGPSDQAVP